jgi:hypothetical protein
MLTSLINELSRFTIANTHSHLCVRLYQCLSLPTIIVATIDSGIFVDFTLGLTQRGGEKQDLSTIKPPPSLCAVGMDASLLTKRYNLPFFATAFLGGLIDVGVP